MKDYLMNMDRNFVKHYRFYTFDRSNENVGRNFSLTHRILNNTQEFSFINGQSLFSLTAKAVVLFN